MVPRGRAISKSEALLYGPPALQVKGSWGGRPGPPSGSLGLHSTFRYLTARLGGGQVDTFKYRPSLAHWR